MVVLLGSRALISGRCAAGVCEVWWASRPVAVHAGSPAPHRRCAPGGARPARRRRPRRPPRRAPRSRPRAGATDDDRPAVGAASALLPPLRCCRTTTIPCTITAASMDDDGHQHVGEDGSLDAARRNPCDDPFSQVPSPTATRRRLAAYSGMLPCFFGGRSSRLPSSLRSDSATIAARLRRLDHVGDVAARRRHVGRGELGPVCGDQLRALRLRDRPPSFDLLAVQDVDRAFGAHHRDFGGRPGEDEVGAHLLAAHREIGAAIGLAGDDRDLRHRRAGA